MCDINDTRKSRRKQHTPSRRSSIGMAAILRVSDDESNTTLGRRIINDGAATLMQNRKSSHGDADNAGSLECEHYLQSATESMQRLSPSTASSTSSSSASSMDYNSLSFDACRREISSYQYINPLHALYLPIAFHNHSINSIQVLGYPQVLIPVAIHRHAQDILKPCLVIDELMAHNIPLPKQIPFGEIQCNLSVTAAQQPYPHPAYPSTSSRVFNTNKKKGKEMISNEIRKRKVPSNDLKPLDLTVRIKQIRQDAQNGSCNCDSIEEDNSSSEKLIPSEPDKKYRCDCGVSFNSEVTLNGHKKYYCHNNANQTTPIREPQKKVAYHCQQCDFLPASASQLAQHVRINHASVQAYVCQICGYKGYSQRGIRSHLRTHTECTDEKIDDLLNSHVHFVTAEMKSVQCKCHKNR